MPPRQPAAGITNGSATQDGLQPLPWMASPSSHSSPAGAFGWPSPQDGAVQSSSQVAESAPVSQVSPVSVTLSPQPAGVQSARQASGVVSEFAPPLSQPSKRLCTTASPQVPLR